MNNFFAFLASLWDSIIQLTKPGKPSGGGTGGGGQGGGYGG